MAARRGRPPRGDTARPGGGEVPGELGLVLALLRQTVTDLQSDKPAHRDAAVDFLQTPVLLHFWCGLAGVEVELFLERTQRWRG